MIANNIDINGGKVRKILAIDDSPIDSALLKLHLQKMGLHVSLAHDAQTGMEIAINEQPDLILLDVEMPGTNGFEVCRKLKNDVRTSSIPVMFISSNEQACDKIIGLNVGGIDYITKPFEPSVLKSRIGIVLEMIKLQEKLISLANTDELTGLVNRRYFFEILDREILQAKITSKALAVMIFDLDHFKSINDTYGHLGGDMVLKQMGKILMENTYPLDVTARCGGEEFFVLMSATSPKQAVKAAERLRRIIDSWQWEVFDEQISVTASVGLANMDFNNPLNSNDIVNRADIALYAAKHKGRNCVVTWGKLNSEKEFCEPKDRNYRELQAKINSLARQLHSHAHGTISALIKAMDIVFDDPFMLGHSEHVQVYADAITEQMGLSSELQKRISTAALLHDFGKISIPQHILQKTTPLTDDEWRIVKQHPVVGVKILSPIRIFDLELAIIKHHHESVDGTGYPNGLKGREIPIGARVLAVADVFDAMTSTRPYRTAKTGEEALKEIIDSAGSQLDVDVVEAFQRAYDKYKEEWPLSIEVCLVKK